MIVLGKIDLWNRRADLWNTIVSVGMWPKGLQPTGAKRRAAD